MNSYLAVSSFINLLTAILLATLLLSSREKSVVKRRYVYLILSTAGWAGAYFVWRLADSESDALNYVRLLLAFSTLTPITFYHFSLALCGSKDRLPLRIGYLIAAVVIVASFSPYTVAGVSAKFGHDYWPDPAPLIWLYLGYIVLYISLTGWTLIKGWLGHLGGRASDCQFVFMSGLVAYAGAISNFPLWFNIPIQPYGNILVSAYMLIVGYALYSKKISGISLDVYKAFLGFFLNISVVFLYLIFLALYKALSGSWLETNEFWEQGILAFAISALAFWGAPKLKFRIERMLDGVFRKEWSTALSELNSLPTKISDLGDADAIAEVACNTIERSLEVNYVSMFTLESFQSAYRCVYTAGLGSSRLAEYELSAENPVVEMLSENPACVVLDQIYGETEESTYQALVELRRALGVSIIVPIFARHEVHGLIFVGQPKTSRVTVDEEISILFNIGAQIGINQRTRDFERRANQMDKLVALGTMAAGLAHEIRNPLVSVQTLASVLKSGKSLSSVPDDFRNVLLRDIKRIASIVEGVALYSYSQEAKKMVVRVEDIIRSSIEIHRDAARDKGVELKLISDDDELLVRGNFEQLGQVFNNLIENAMHAVTGVESPLVEISLQKRVVRRLKSQSWVEVSVRDNGSGVAKGIIDRIFDPFITSKDTGTREEKKGMGLGLAICKRIIENHEGAITVQNNLDFGAKFIVSLKCINLTEANA